MTTAAFGHVLPWTEEEYLALGETPGRVELFDGSLPVSPAPTPGHQDLSFRLAVALMPAAATAGLRVYLAVNVRLRHGQIPIPDLVVVEPADPSHAVIDASAVRLVAEIVSPSNAATDPVLKMHYYAEAAIPFYLLVDRTPEPRLRLFRLETGRYAAGGEGRPGQLLRLTDPFTVTLDAAALAQ